MLNDSWLNVTDDNNHTIVLYHLSGIIQLLVALLQVQSVHKMKHSAAIFHRAYLMF